MAKVTFQLDGRDSVSTEVRDGASVLDVARRLGISIDAPCAGNGTCGKCTIKLLSGEVISEKNRHISDADYSGGLRLACISQISGDANFYVPPSADTLQNKIKVMDRPKSGAYTYKDEYMERGFPPETNFCDISVTLSEPSLDDQMADRERLITQLSAICGIKEDAVKLTLSALRELPIILRDSTYSCHALCKLPKNDSASQAVTVYRLAADELTPVGLAIDIGTTSVSVLLVNLATGDVLFSANSGNSQTRFGADVIHRIIESTKPGGLDLLRSAIIDDCLNPLIKEVCISANIATDSIVRVSIAGNTTMMHLLMGVYTDYLRREPYVPAFFRPGELRGADLALNIHADAEIVITPAVGSYVGGDITAGTFASAMADSDALSLFIDLGTNGEIVLGNSDYLMTCACSAGPAFEGGDISCGMRAADGAIEAFDIDVQTMEPSYSIIGGNDEKPRGICGSGIIDIVAALFRSGIIDAKGKFAKESERIVKDVWGITSYTVVFPEDTDDCKAITIDDADIDNFIRAKGSVFSAIRTLLESVGAELSDIDNIYIAGGIGSGIDFENAVSVGMLPDVPREKYRYIGNSSLSGAYATLISPKAEQAVVDVSGSMTYIELSSYPGYMDEFIAACFLPHTDASLFAG